MSDHWDFYFANVNHHLASIFVNLGLREEVPDAEKPWLLWVWVYFNQPREDGLSSAEEAETLANVEDVLADALAVGMEAQAVGRITTDGRREFYFYGNTFAGFEELVAQTFTAFPDYRCDSGSENDPEWGHYVNVLYPTAYNWQQINNRHVLDALTEAGDPLTKPRTVSHWAYFPDETAAKQFAAAIQENGFTLAADCPEQETEEPYRWKVNFERVDQVDWSSINDLTIELLDLTESNGGDYDGWETSAEKEEKED